MKIILTKTVPMKWSPRNKKYYEEKGYKYTKTGNVFQLTVDDLAPSSRSFKLLVKCPSCKRLRMQRMGNITANGHTYCGCAQRYK